MKNIKKKAMIARQLAGDKTKQKIRRKYPLNISHFKVKEGQEQVEKQEKYGTKNQLPNLFSTCKPQS